MKRRSVPFVAGIAVLATSAYLIGQRTGERSAGITPYPPVLQKVQALGELHTAKFTYQNVFEHRTSRQPSEWANWVPGAAQLVQATTQNRALVQVGGSVEAGVDLQKSKIEGNTLVLPRAEIYRPHLDAKVFDQKRGLVWRDENIALSALKEAESIFTDAAHRQGIRDEAEKNALIQVRRIVPGSMDIRFEPARNP